MRLGEIVYLKTDPEQQGRMVTAIRKTLGGTDYELSLGECVSCHYAEEISIEKDLVKTFQ